MKRAQEIAAAVLATLAIVIVFGTSGLEFWSGISPGPRFMPLLIATAIVVLSGAYAYEGRRMLQAPADSFPKGSDGWRVVLLALAIIGFAVMSLLLGIIPSAFAFVLLTLVFVLRQPLLPSILASAITIAVIFSIFVAWLDMRLPTGIFGI